MFSPYHPFQLAFGLTVWAIWFSAIYGGMTVGCMAAPPPIEQGPYTWINAILLGVTLFTAGFLVYWSHKCLRAGQAAEAKSSRRMIAWVGAGVHLTAAVATLGVGASALFFPPCV
jgi:hypothetical protein